MSDDLKTEYEEKSELAKSAYLRQVKEFYAKNAGLAQYMSKVHSSEVSDKEGRLKQRRQRNLSYGVPSGSRSTKTEWIDPYHDAPPQPRTPVYVRQTNILQIG
jgi:hypothetical protein